MDAGGLAGDSPAELAAAMAAMDPARRAALVETARRVATVAALVFAAPIDRRAEVYRKGLQDLDATPAGLASLQLPEAWGPMAARELGGLMMVADDVLNPRAPQ